MEIFAINMKETADIKNKEIRQNDDLTNKIIEELSQKIIDSANDGGYSTWYELPNHGFYDDKIIYDYFNNHGFYIYSIDEEKNCEIIKVIIIDWVNTK